MGATLVSGITLTSANDAPERDPASYRLEGSFDGTTFFPIASGACRPFPRRFYKNYIFFPNTRAYQTYRLIFPEVARVAGGNSMQIAEVELLGDVADLAPDVTLPGDPIVPTSNNTPGSEGAANAIDNQPTKYLNFDKLNTGFTVDTSARGLTVVSGITLTSANDAPERDPADYVLSGSYDGVSFTQIAAGAVPAFPSRFFKNTILFDNKVPYQSYRLIFPNVANAAAANSMQISEVELLGVLADTDVTTPGDPIVASSNNTPGSEGVANAIDNQPTKYLNFDKLNTGLTVTPRVGGTIVVGLSLTSANDAPERDPATYQLSGSEDGQNFVLISSGTVPPFPSRFFKNYIFFPNNTEFAAYRLIFPDVVNSSAANSMQIAEVEFLGHQRGGGSCVIQTNGVLVRRQPQDTPVLVGSTATFRVGLTGPWKVQWYRDGQPIPGANNASYTTPVASAADDGAHFYAKVGPATVGGVRGLCETTDEVMLSIFTPSETESIGLSWAGAGANGAPTAMLPQDITGFTPQAYWNNLTGGSGTASALVNSRNEINGTVSVTWATSGEWGAGTGTSDPLERMLNGMCTSASTDEGGAQTVTFAGVPAGNHSLFLYTVQVPQEFFNMDFAAVTHDAGGSDVIQRRYIRPLNSDEYNPSPGFGLVTATTAADRSVGNMMRFDNLQPGPDGFIQVRFFSPGRVDLPGGDPIRGPGLNGLQLFLNPPSAGDPPVITRQPAAANGIAGGCITLCVEAAGPNLTYQWLKNGQAIAGATAPCLTLASLQTSSAGSYSVAINNPAGRVLSRSAVVDVVSSDQLTLGLVTYYKFDDDPSSVSATNAVPGGLDGQVHGGFPDWPPGQIGGSLGMFYANYVSVANYTKVSKAMTVAGWVSGSTSWGPLINNWVEGQATGSSGQFKVDVEVINGVTTLSGLIEVGPNRVLASAPVDDPDPFNWHHFAMSANGTTLSIYWDGQLVGAADYLGTINSTPSIPSLVIGANLDSAGNVVGELLNASIDDFALWNRSLSAAEIAHIYNSGLAAKDISQAGPILTAGICPPTIVCPNDIAAECAGSGGTPVTFQATATDQDGNPLQVTCIPASGSSFPQGQTTVTCTATAAPGYSSSCSFRVTVTDTLGPVVTCPPAMMVEGQGPGGSAVTFVATAADACEGARPVVCAPASGSTFPVGATIVTCSATDSAGHTGSCAFTVTVVDTTPPTIVCPADITAESGTPVTWEATATDNVDASVAVTCVPPSGSSFPLGATTVTCTATDAAGNSSSCSFTVTGTIANVCPTADANVVPPYQLVDGAFTVISTDNTNATVMFDGSMSTDLDGDALTYVWFEVPPPHGTLTPVPPGKKRSLKKESGKTLPAGECAYGRVAQLSLQYIGHASPVTVVVVQKDGDIIFDGTVNHGEIITVTGTGKDNEMSPEIAILVDGEVNAGFITNGSKPIGPGLASGDFLITEGWTRRGNELCELAPPPLDTEVQFGAGVVAERELFLGVHAVRLDVFDGTCTSSQSILVEVITPCDAVEHCMTLVSSSTISEKDKRPLIEALKHVCGEFDKGKFKQGIDKLEGFINKVEKAKDDKIPPATKAQFIACAQFIIDALTP